MGTPDEKWGQIDGSGRSESRCRLILWKIAERGAAGDCAKHAAARVGAQAPRRVVAVTGCRTWDSTD